MLEERWKPSAVYFDDAVYVGSAISSRVERLSLPSGQPGQWTLVSTHPSPDVCVFASSHWQLAHRAYFCPTFVDDNMAEVFELRRRTSTAVSFGVIREAATHLRASLRQLNGLVSPFVNEVCVCLGGGC